MDAEEDSTDEKTVQKTVKPSDFGAKTSCYSSKFKILNSKFEFQASFALLTSNITYIKRLRSMATEEASTDKKTAKKQWKTVILRQN